MVQAVCSHGRLVAYHANLRVREGARGGASHKRSIDLPDVRHHMAMLGEALGWHGALSADAVLTQTGPLYIDINPRLVEPANAQRSGVDLVGAVLDLCMGRDPAGRPRARPGVGTHQLLLAVLGAAQRGHPRRAVLTELAAALTHRDGYQESIEELTPAHRDVRAAVPLVIASAATLVDPAAWRWFASGAVANYALTPEAWREILAWEGATG
jgi:hypothetical protein